MFLVLSMLGAAWLAGALGEPVLPSTQANRVCWVSNAGFYIDTPDADILIDAILSSDDEIARAEGALADVGLIFVSHVHGDHFNAAGTARSASQN